jgi:hypothetical protein
MIESLGFSNRIKNEVNNLIDFYQDYHGVKPVGICFISIDNKVFEYLRQRFPEKFYLANGKEVEPGSEFDDGFEHYRFANNEERINFLKNILKNI